MKPTALIIALFAAGLGAQPNLAQAQTAATRPSEYVINVISYNVQFLPSLARMANNRPNPEYRAQTIGQKLQHFDIIGLNEVFDDTYRNLLLAQLQRAWPDDYHVLLSPEPPGPRFNGGLAIVSRLPFIETHTTLYTKYSTPKQYGFKADGFAAKGALHARIRPANDAPKNSFIDVFVTHLESKDHQAREAQYAELSTFIAKHSTPDHPTLIMGDFNTAGNPPDQRNPNSKYHLLLSLLRKARPAVVDLWPALQGLDAVGGTNIQETTEQGRRIDYIFLANPKKKSAETLTPLSIRVNGYLDPAVTALSDHSAVEAKLRWNSAK